MEDPGALESALSQVEAVASEASKAAANLLREVRKLEKTVRSGNLKELPRARETAERAVDTAVARVREACASWTFEEELYFSGRRYIDELRAAAERAGLSMIEHDERLHCFPLLVRALPAERVVQIGKKKERRLRPSVLVELLKSEQGKPLRFPSEIFIKLLYEAYRSLTRSPHPGEPVPLRLVYNQLTLWPDSRKEYSIQEFARDVYLLDKKGLRTGPRGAEISFPASTGTKSDRDCITVVTEDGRERKYFAVAFTRESE